MGVALPPDLGGLQDAGVPQLNQNLLPVELVGLAVVVGLDTADKVRLPSDHLGQQVHERKLKRAIVKVGRVAPPTRYFQNKSIKVTLPL